MDCGSEEVNVGLVDSGCQSSSNVVAGLMAAIRRVGTIVAIMVINTRATATMRIVGGS